MDEKTCKTCRWGDKAAREGANASYGYAKTDDKMRCRRYPPDRVSAYSVRDYPTVLEVDWCGEHTPKEPSNAR